MEVDTQILAVMSAVILAGHMAYTGIREGSSRADDATALALKLIDNARAATAANVREEEKR